MNNKNTNRLIHETSPYLLQHAHNPVDWFPWGEDALEAAKSLDKLMVISIGYSACHWCHVMEKESFEDTGIAKLMNEQYVSIKIDREERPDIDQVYMQAAYLITGSGGWPLNIIALPDGRPVYAGTYFTKSKWEQVLSYFTDLHKNQREILLQQAESLSGEMKQNIHVPGIDEGQNLSLEQLKQIYNSISNKIDPDKGGMWGAPKFPMPVIHEFLLYYHKVSGNKEALSLTINSLEKMAAGGIYDHLGGGFCRYSTDAEWKVPHFEKMLYDNAQLISLYAKAFSLTSNQGFKDVVSESIAFVARELSSPEGAFYAALDADSEGEEGRYYVWHKNEIEKIAGKQSEVFCKYYNITEEGNWEDGKNIPLRSPAFDLPPGEEQRNLENVKSILLQEREKRIRPALDDKILCSWNALMLKALLDAYRYLEDKSYLQIALKNAHFMEDKMIADDYAVFRTYKDGKTAINGFLDDYAFLADAFIALYQLTLDEHWLKTAHELTSYAITHFYDPEKNCFFYTSDLDPALIVRPIENSDNVIPASSSQMLINLFALSQYFDNELFADIYQSLLKSMLPGILKNPAFNANWSLQLISEIFPPAEIAITGPKTATIIKELAKHYLPGVLFSGGEKSATLSHLGYKYIEGKTMVYVCRNKSCERPVESLQETKDLLSKIYAGFEEDFLKVEDA